MFERTGQGLRDLIGQTGRCIVGQAVVLAPLVSEFRLQKRSARVTEPSRYAAAKPSPTPASK
jgi:hypothetical protein